MVSKRRLNYGSTNYHFDSVPRGPRSVRRRSAQLDQGGETCAIEILAAVAGKLLKECESFSSSNLAEGKDQFGTPRDDTKKESHDEKVLKPEFPDKGSCVESIILPEPSSPEHNINYMSEVLPYSQVKTEPSKNKDGDGFTCKVGGSFDLENLCGSKVDDRYVEKEVKENLIAADTCANDEGGIYVNNSVPINTDCRVKLPLYSYPLPYASFIKHRSDVKLDVHDDDENYFCYVRSRAKIRAFKSRSRFGYRRIRKMLTSRYWKVAPRPRDFESFKTVEGMKPWVRNKKFLCSRRKYQLLGPSNRRKLLDHSFAVASNQEARFESISKSHVNEPTMIKRARGARLIKNKQILKDSNVKFSINSVKVPELCVEVPETATVGSLKRIVKEAVTKILGGELHIGLVHQGKKVRDDNRTLQQAGIFLNGNLDALGFILEPTLTSISPTKSVRDPPLSLPCNLDQQLPGSNGSAILDSGCSNTLFDQVTMTCEPPETDHDLASLPNIHCDSLADGYVQECKALVPVPSVNFGPLSVVPANQKTKRSEFSHRRIRRPFSVAEVEALVDAVEKLGTGRWRDVKMRAFDSADHRTYVDLKDKWKTLVHTASISPQQRRGEPVPQELLDKVLSVHAYWSQHQPRQHSKHHTQALRVSNAPLQKVVA